jgi:hypothetical protein
MSKQAHNNILFSKPNKNINQEVIKIKSINISNRWNSIQGTFLIRGLRNILVGSALRIMGDRIEMGLLMELSIITIWKRLILVHIVGIIYQSPRKRIEEHLLQEMQNYMRKNNHWKHIMGIKLTVKLLMGFIINHCRRWMKLLKSHSIGKNSYKNTQ